ncbi:YbbR-like domain-containing protein [Salegentibacter sp. F188]|uniref:YbbR-like domain-containing protein n=1 Tax=Autumnicola patrickiae TaxID=3075591 RepID=A0ABU3DX29_9FLAO|nr:YbbR-like domain-containing protein [Salegentibacter sp. F188]MDT0688276.1 YbbR-like domain-containing protein [Salegentibacter sp. F188]
MLNRLRIRRRSFKKANVKTFSVFLFFSALTWLLVQLSKEYTQIIEIPLQYTNAPLDKSISNEKPESVPLRIEDRGFFIIYYQLFKPELNVDLANAEVEEGNLVYVIDSNLSEISEELQIDLENSAFLEDEIRIPFQPKKETRVAVIPNIEINYAVGYSAGESIALEPDSITVSGPQNVIDTITRVQTVNLKRNGINRDVSGMIPLDTANMNMISFYETEVRYSLEVEKYTEGSVQIPVEVTNVPDNLNLAYFPKRILLYYQVNLDDYEKVKASDFRVVCDYSRVREEQDYFLAEIIEKPDFVTNVRLSERKIQFVIKK